MINILCVSTVIWACFYFKIWANHKLIQDLVGRGPRISLALVECQARWPGGLIRWPSTNSLLLTIYLPTVTRIHWQFSFIFDVVFKLIYRFITCLHLVETIDGKFSEKVSSIMTQGERLLWRHNPHSTRVDTFALSRSSRQKGTFWNYM